MEEIGRVLEEISEEVNHKLEKTAECVVEGRKKEYMGGGDEGVLLVCGGHDGKRKEEEDEDDETEEDDQDTEEDDDDTGEDWHEDNGRRSLPYTLRYLDPRPLCTAGAGYTPEASEKMAELVHEKNYDMLAGWSEMADNSITPLPARPLSVLPEITIPCAYGDVCYHREYWTDIISEIAPIHPYFRPCGMLQVFSLRLSSTLAHPVNIYGTFAVRDCWEPRRNYLFERSRDYPAIVAPGCSVLPLCSPCRGIFVLQYVLLDIDLWIKEEGGMSSDKQLFSGYIELNACLSGFEKLKGRIQDGLLGLDIHYAFLCDAIETVIEVLAAAEYPSDVKISASTSGFDDKIALYDGTFFGTGVISRHFVAVRKLEQLHVFLKLDDSMYKWTFQAGVGVLAAPDGPVSGFAQFEVNVSFKTKGKEASAWKWRCICNEVCVTEMCL